MKAFGFLCIIGLASIQQSLSSQEIPNVEDRRSVSSAQGDVHSIQKRFACKLKNENTKAIKRLTETLSEVTKTITTLQKENEEIEINYKNLSKTVERNFLQTSSLQATVQKLTQENTMLKKKLQTGDGGGSAVAFTAGASSSYSLYSGSTIRFNTVRFQVGGGFYKGVFIAPVPGVYAFYVTLQTTNEGKVIADIAKNGVRQVRAMGDSAYYNLWMTATNFVILNLQKGDRVDVRYSSGRGIYTSSSLICTFSGFKL